MRHEVADQGSERAAELGLAADRDLAIAFDREITFVEARSRRLKPIVKPPIGVSI
jgi:hypothetical protein